MNDTTIALALVLVVLVIAAAANRWVAIAASLLAFAGFNFFFLPPIGTFTIAKQDDLIALLTLLAVSLIGSHLSYQARRRAEEAVAMAAQRNEAEIARRNAEAKAALVASLSHDLKTPLTALTVATANLTGAALSQPERDEQAEIVQMELARLRRLFDNVTELASIEARATSSELQWVPAVDIVDAACQHTAAVLTSHQLQITGNGDDRLVHIDPRLTTAALVHVLQNAAAYSPPGSLIEIDVRVAHGRLTISVRDHGPGLAPEDLERMFERFYRGARHDQFGSGMGLAITRGLLAIQHGQVTAANHAQGGAVFTIDIPVASRPADVSLDVA